MPVSHARLLDSPWLEPVLLRVAARRARASSDAARMRMKPWLSAARARYRVALDLQAPEDRAVALELLREAARLALLGLASRGSEAEPRATEQALVWDRLQQMPDADGAPARREDVRALFARDEPLAFELLAPADLEGLSLAAEQTVAWLLSVAELRSPVQVRRARLARCALAVLALGLVLWAMVSYGLGLAALAEAAP